MADENNHRGANRRQRQPQLETGPSKGGGKVGKKRRRRPRIRNRKEGRRKSTRVKTTVRRLSSISLTEGENGRLQGENRRPRRCVNTTDSSVVGAHYQDRALVIDFLQRPRSTEPSRPRQSVTPITLHTIKPPALPRLTKKALNTRTQNVKLTSGSTERPRKRKDIRLMMTGEDEDQRPEQGVSGTV